MTTRKNIIALTSIAIAALVFGAANTANAQVVYYGAPAYYAPAPVYYAPAPVVVAPAPVYYSRPVVCYPRPVYYSAPVYSSYYAPAYRSGFSFGFSWSGGHHHH